MACATVCSWMCRSGSRTQKLNTAKLQMRKQAPNKHVARSRRFCVAVPGVAAAALRACLGERGGVLYVPSGLHEERINVTLLAACSSALANKSGANMAGRGIFHQRDASHTNESS